MVENALRDINVLIGQFKQRPDTLLPSADTVGRGLKKLAEKNIVYKSETSGKSYSFNTAEKLNTLLLRMIQRMGLVKAGSHVDMDFDHQFIPAHKFDVKYSLNKQHVFVAFIFPNGLGGGLHAPARTNSSLSSLSITRRGKKTSQHTKSSHKKKCCGIKVIYIIIISNATIRRFHLSMH